MKIFNILNKVAAPISGASKHSATQPAASASNPPIKAEGKSASETFANARDRGGFLPQPIPSRTVVAASPSLSEFENRFTQEPYFPRAFNGRTWLAERPRVPESVAAFIAKECPITETQSKLLLELWLAWEGTNRTIERCSFMGTSIAFQTQMQEWQSRRERGELVDDREILSKEQFTERSNTLRQLARSEQRRISRQVHPVLKAICDRRAEFCREQVIKLDKEERSRADDGFSYEPSQKLRVLIYMAVCGCFVSVENWIDSMPWLPPSPDWWGTALFQTPKDEAAITAAAKKLEAEKARADWGEAEETRRREQSEAEATKDHAAQLEKINAFNDSLRESFADFRKERVALRKAAADE